MRTSQTFNFPLRRHYRAPFYQLNAWIRIYLCDSLFQVLWNHKICQHFVQTRSQSLFPYLRGGASKGKALGTRLHFFFSIIIILFIVSFNSVLSICSPGSYMPRKSRGIWLWQHSRKIVRFTIPSLPPRLRRIWASSNNKKTKIPMQNTLDNPVNELGRR